MTKPPPNAPAAVAGGLMPCLRIGWERSLLDKLEALWWEYHDRNGALK